VRLDFASLLGTAMGNLLMTIPLYWVSSVAIKKVGKNKRGINLIILIFNFGISTILLALIDTFSIDNVVTTYLDILLLSWIANNHFNIVKEFKKQRRFFSFIINIFLGFVSAFSTPFTLETIFGSKDINLRNFLDTFKDERYLYFSIPLILLAIVFLINYFLLRNINKELKRICVIQYAITYILTFALLTPALIYYFTR